MGGGGSTYIPPIGVGAALRTDRGFQRIVELGEALPFSDKIIQPVRLDDGTHRLVVCDGERFWMFVAATGYVNEWIQQSPGMPVVSRQSAFRFAVDVGRTGNKPIVVEVEFAECERRV